jgi:hypothetical protein
MLHARHYRRLSARSATNVRSAPNDAVLVQWDVKGVRESRNRFRKSPKRYRKSADRYEISREACGMAIEACNDVRERNSAGARDCKPPLEGCYFVF